MYITFEFSTESLTLDIELVDNPAIKSWTERVLKNSRSAHARLEDPFQRYTATPGLLQEYLDKLRELLDTMESYGFPFTDVPFPKDVDSITREWTNKLHRYFTHTQRIIDFTNRQDWSAEQHDIYKKEIGIPLHDINEYVHLIEIYMPLPIDYIADCNEIYISAQPAYDDPGWWQMEDTWRQHHSREHCDVIFGSQILGKTILRSYMDGDDPNDWDTTGHYSNNGALQIVLGPTLRETIYKSTDFNQWLEKHGRTVETSWYDFPVGNIRNREVIPELMEKMAGGGWYNVKYGL